MDWLPLLAALLGGGGIGGTIVNAVVRHRGATLHAAQAELAALVDTLQGLAVLAQAQRDETERRYRIIERYADDTNRGIREGTVPPPLPYPTAELWPDAPCSPDPAGGPRQ